MPHVGTHCSKISMASSHMKPGFKAHPALFAKGAAKTVDKGFTCLHICKVKSKEGHDQATTEQLSHHFTAGHFSAGDCRTSIKTPMTHGANVAPVHHLQQQMTRLCEDLKHASVKATVHQAAQTIASQVAIMPVSSEGAFTGSPLLSDCGDPMMIVELVHCMQGTQNSGTHCSRHHAKAV